MGAAPHINVLANAEDAPIDAKDDNGAPLGSSTAAATGADTKSSPFGDIDCHA